MWLDVKMDQRDEAAMRRGVENSSAVIALLSASYFDRPFCLKELAWWGCMCKVYVQAQARPRLETAPLSNFDPGKDNTAL